MTEQQQGWFKVGEPGGACPAADELWSFARAEMTADRRDAVRDHLAGCVWCSEKIARLNDPVVAADSVFEPVPIDLNRKIRRLWTVNPIQLVWRSQIIWMLLFIASIVVSFTLPRYYKQFLVIALVCGIRWALSERASRHAITITKIGSGRTQDQDLPDRRLDRHIKS